jgi:hypothetical protein
LIWGTRIWRKNFILTTGRYPTIGIPRKWLKNFIFSESESDKHFHASIPRLENSYYNWKFRQKSTSVTKYWHFKINLQHWNTPFFEKVWILKRKSSAQKYWLDCIQHTLLPNLKKFYRKRAKNAQFRCIFWADNAYVAT